MGSRKVYTRLAIWIRLVGSTEKLSDGLDLGRQRAKFHRFEVSLTLVDRSDSCSVTDIFEKQVWDELATIGRSARTKGVPTTRRVDLRRDRKHSIDYWACHTSLRSTDRTNGGESSSA